MDELEFAGSFKPAPATSVAEVLRRAALAPDRDEIAQGAAEKAAADARAEQRELTAMLDKAAGSPIQQVTRCQGQVAEARAECDDLEAKLAQAQGRLRRAAESLVGWQEQAEQVMTAARRESDDPLVQASRRAHEAFKEVTRAKIAALAAGTPQRERRPKGIGGEVSRSHLECIHCVRENVDAETSALLHLDPERPVPVTTAADEAALAASGHRDQAERRRRDDYGMAVR